MNQRKRLSVVIAIKDGEPERLDIALRSHRSSSLGDQVEIVVSDYGSQDSGPIEKLCLEHECIYVYTDASVWSRSRALNIGLAVASCNVMLTTDADTVFAPKTLERAVECLERVPRSVILAQCSSLSERFTLSRLKELPWQEIYEDAVLLPRSSAGGLCAFDRDTLEAVRGFEERMLVRGEEDNDFVKRVRQAGRFMRWIHGTGVGIFHVWNPDSLLTHANAEKMLEADKKILTQDRTTARNYIGPVCFAARKPLVSVHLLTCNRGPMIAQVIESVLHQTVQDFEIIVYDDGSTDRTCELIAAFADPRICYIYSDANAGVAAARNYMLDQSRGQFICVHDDDSLMLPNRLELQLGAMVDGLAGCYAGSVNYDDRTGALSRQAGKAPFGLPMVAFVGPDTVHRTLMVKADVLRRLRYAETFRGGLDYDLAFRIAASGYRLGHCGDYAILRSVHEERLSSLSNRRQKAFLRVTTAAFLNTISSEVEAALRWKAQAVQPVQILPVFDDRALTALLPDELFDVLVVTSPAIGVQVDTGLHLHRAGVAPTHLVMRERAAFSWRPSDDEVTETVFRVPRSREETRGAARAAGLVSGIVTELDLSASAVTPPGRSVFVLECSVAYSSMMQGIVDSNTQLASAVAYVRDEGLAFIVVEAITPTIARLIAYRVRFVLQSAGAGHPSLADADADGVASLEYER